MIQGNAKIMNVITDDRVQLDRNAGYSVKSKYILRSLLVAISNNSLPARRLHPLGFTVEVVEMGSCPVEFDQDTRQVGVVHLLPWNGPAIVTSVPTFHVSHS